jgi:hypothetical protein
MKIHCYRYQFSLHNLALMELTRRIKLAQEKEEHISLSALDDMKAYITDSLDEVKNLQCKRTDCYCYPNIIRCTSNCPCSEKQNWCNEWITREK